MPGVKLPSGLQLWSCFDKAECDWGEKVNENFNILNGSQTYCVKGVEGSIYSDSSAFPTPQPGDSYIDTANCQCVYLSADKGWVCTPLPCGKIVYDVVNEQVMQWTGTEFCLLFSKEFIELTGPIAPCAVSTFQDGTFGYDTTTNAADAPPTYIEYITINGVWVATSRIYDPATCMYVGGEIVDSTTIQIIENKILENTTINNSTLTTACVTDGLQFSDTAAAITPAAGKCSIQKIGGIFNIVDDTGTATPLTSSTIGSLSNVKPAADAPTADCSIIVWDQAGSCYDVKPLEDPACISMAGNGIPSAGTLITAFQPVIFNSAFIMDQKDIIYNGVSGGFTMPRTGKYHITTTLEITGDWGSGSVMLAGMEVFNFTTGQTLRRDAQRMLHTAGVTVRSGLYPSISTIFHADAGDEIFVRSFTNFGNPAYTSGFVGSTVCITEYSKIVDC